MQPSYPARKLDGLDITLVAVFLLGLYLGVSLQISEKVPLTCAPSGFAGLIMLWRRRDQVQPRHLAGLLGVVCVYLGSILAASDYEFLGKRFTGLLQLTYSLAIGYAMFLTLVHGERRQIANLLLTFCLVIIVGCLLETYAGLRPLSDAVRERIYASSNVYDADLRDQLLYGRIRPKLFTSEPSAVTFAYTHYSSVWLVVSPWRWKLPVYFGLMALALFVLPGPTLMLMLLLTVPYLVFLAGARAGGRPSTTRLVGSLALSLVLVGLAIVLGRVFFAERLNDLATGKDASFFFRFTGPMLVAFDLLRDHPWAGAGLTGEPYIADRVIDIFMNSPSFEAAWQVGKVSDTLTNFFWLHWIYLGLVWGVICLVAVSIWLRMLGTPSVLYCWAVWIILGQASGSYVGPKTWAVLLIAAAVAILTAGARQPRSSPRPLPRVHLQPHLLDSSGYLR
ncbi:MAG: hypothetical protein JOY64_00340 [Alphaproteobacteria bacterium]|nr:hypothetical protein [Alphaproteobacteria bacterium]